MMPTNAPDPWEWILHRDEGFTLTFTHGISTSDLLQRYGLDPSAARLLPGIGIDAVLQPSIDSAILRVGQLNDWAFGIEILGMEGATAATAIKLSQGSETVILQVNPGRINILSSWVDGQPREAFEPGMADSLQSAGPHPFWDATERHRADQHDVRAILAALRAVEDHIGAHLTPDLHDGPLLSTLVPQIRPRRPSPLPPLPLVNPPATPTRGLGRHLGTLHLPER
jgi:hypothetical protein